jgi:hypothetical protein
MPVVLPRFLGSSIHAFGGIHLPLRYIAPSFRVSPVLYHNALPLLLRLHVTITIDVYQDFIVIGLFDIV